MHIKLANLEAPDLQDLLQFHLEQASQQACSTAFSIERLAHKDMYFFEARTETDELMGCAGFKMLSPNHGEIKSVRTHPHHLRKGVSSKLMAHVTSYARKLGISRLSLETHPTPAYAAARALYERLGYTYCEPFGDYTNTDTSVYMTREI